MWPFKPKFEVKAGQLWCDNTSDNPFLERHCVEVLEVKDGYVKYTILKLNGQRTTHAMSLNSFKYYYKYSETNL